jgi:hypothetical protein
MIKHEAIITTHMMVLTEMPETEVHARGEDRKDVK